MDMLLRETRKRECVSMGKCAVLETKQGDQSHPHHLLCRNGLERPMVENIGMSLRHKDRQRERERGREESGLVKRKRRRGL